jgi:hypothetical protein
MHSSRAILRRDPANLMVRNFLRSLGLVLALAGSAHARAAPVTDSRYHAGNATPQMLYGIDDFLVVLDAIDPKAAAARGSHREAVYDLDREGADDPGKNYVAAAVHAVAFDAGGATVQTLLVILPPSEDPASARRQLLAGVLKAITDQGGTATPVDTAGGNDAADFAITAAGRPFGHVLLRQRGRHFLLVSVLSRYVLPDARSRERLLAPKLDALLDFAPVLVPAQTPR